MDCKECGSPVYRTGENHPTVDPIWFYSCWNWHTFKSKDILAPINPLMREVILDYGSELNWK